MVVRADMDNTAMVKTLIHEAAHVVLHEGPPGRYLPRPVKEVEVEAESVAYVVVAAHGMATDGYSFPYVAGWARPEPAEAVRSRTLSDERPSERHLTGPGFASPCWRRRCRPGVDNRRNQTRVHTWRERQCRGGPAVVQPARCHPGREAHRG